MQKSNKIWIDQIQSELKELLQESFAKELADTLFAGRMLRSSLTGYLCDFNFTPASKFGAIATELVHSASLLHDDVIDGALIRRFSPAMWQEHGTSAAILTGDFMVTLAFEQILSSNDIELSRLFASTLKKICESEASQELEKESDKSIAKAMEIAAGKTGALFGFAAAASDLQNRDKLFKAGVMLGTAYQLADDLADAFGTADELGKTLGNDAKNGKLTVLTAGASTEKVRQLIEEEIYEATMLFAECGKKECLAFYLESIFRPAICELLRGVK